MAADEPKSLDVDLDDIESRVQALVERGLKRYGSGDLEGAMSEWEHALALDPENPRAQEYVGYVQKNFEVLDATFRAATEVSDPSVELDVPFGLEEVGGGEVDEDAYESLEIGEKGVGAEEPESPPSSPASGDFSSPASVDEGWDIDEGWAIEGLPVVSTAQAGPSGGAGHELEAEAPGEIVLEAEEPGDAEEEEDHEFGDETSQGAGEVEPFSSGLSDDAILALGTPSPDETRAADEAAERSAEVGGMEPADFEDMETDGRRDDRFSELELGEAGHGGGPSQAEMEQHLASLEADLGHGGTVELGSRALTDEPTNELEREEATSEIPSFGDAPITGEGSPSAPESIDFDEVARDLLARVGADADAEDPEERSRGRVASLLDLARREHRAGERPTAVVALDLALEEASKSARAQGMVDEHHGDFLEVYEDYLGDSHAVPALAVPLHELEMHKLDHRAAFLLSRIDGALSVEDILDVCGMSRLEAYRHLCRLLAQGILKVR